MAENVINLIGGLYRYTVKVIAVMV